jgi:hypothetical protein
MDTVERNRIYSRNYYRTHKEKLKKLYDCVCGSKISKNTRTKHKRSNIHGLFMKGYNEQLKLLEMINNAK